MSIQLKWLNASTTPPLRGIRSVPYERSRVASAPDPPRIGLPRNQARSSDGFTPRSDRVRSRLHTRRVALVAEAEVGGECIGADAWPLGDAPLLALRAVGDQEHLH